MSDIRLVLFDLDGTLADTAPDLAAAANRQRVERGMDALPLSALRPWASHGAGGILGRAFDVARDDEQFEPLRQQFLDYYSERLCVETKLFPQMENVLGTLEQRGVLWGIVTNKAARFTDPLIEAMGLATRAACVVSGDTTAHLKPHPASLIEALRRCSTDATHAMYIGDDLRDIAAGKAAHLQTVAAGWGYLYEPTGTANWDADYRIESPEELLPIVLGENAGAHQPHRTQFANRR